MAKSTNFFEMNIRVGEPHQLPSANPLLLLEDAIVVKATQQAALSAILDGFNCIVYNFVRDGQSQLVEKDICDFKGFDLEKLWIDSIDNKQLPKNKQLFKPNFNKIKQFNRLTLHYTTVGYIHQVINIQAKPLDKSSKVLNSYDLLAVRPSHDLEPLFDQLSTKSDADIVSVDCSKQFSYFITKSQVRQALKRGLQFEICWGSGCFENNRADRVRFLCNAINLVKLCKGVGIIMSSEASNKINMRSPTDFVCLATSLSIPQSLCLATVRENCELCFKHAHLRKTFKGVAELVHPMLESSSSSENEEENNDEQDQQKDQIMTE